ncbi:MAG: amidohydrolase [Planctomycetaceae bacterium]|nr:amidohydrolase [Planctomycetaceae bacterium]
MDSLRSASKLLNRRRFQSLAVAHAGWFTAMTGVAPASAKLSSVADQKGPYVDMHTHLGQTWNSTEYLSAEVLLRWMDSVQIEQAVVLPLVSPESSSYPLTSDFVLGETRGHRDRLIPFCSIDPRTSYRGGLKGLVAMLKRYQDAGAKGFGEHKPGLAVDDPRNMTIYAACAEVKLPLLFHLDNQRNTDAPGLPGLEKALQAHPGCTFIGHGPGWWASISGNVTRAEMAGYPKGEPTPGGAIDRLMAKYRNLYGDLSAGSGANSISRGLKFGREFLLRRQDRIMFGTDYLAPKQPIPQFELFERMLDLPTEVTEKIYRGNARRVLGLS